MIEGVINPSCKIAMAPGCFLLYRVLSEVTVFIFLSQPVFFLIPKNLLIFVSEENLCLVLV